MKTDAMSGFFHPHLSLDGMEVEEFSNFQPFNLACFVHSGQYLGHMDYDIWIC